MPCCGRLKKCKGDRARRIQGLKGHRPQRTLYKIMGTHLHSSIPVKIYSNPNSGTRNSETRSDKSLKFVCRTDVCTCTCVHLLVKLENGKVEARTTSSQPCSNLRHEIQAVPEGEAFGSGPFQRRFLG